MTPCPAPNKHARTHTPARHPVARSLHALALCVALTACGSDSSPPPPPPVAPPATVSGVAATGAAYAGAVVTVIDARGIVVGTSPALGSNGAFSIELAPGAQAPLVLQAVRPGAEGSTDALVGMLESAATGVANVTSVSTLIAARLSPSGNPLSLAAEVHAQPDLVTAATLLSRIAEVKEILAPVLAATNTLAFDPLKGTFTADGTGYDRLLDAISVHIIPASATSSNIEVGIKATPATPGEQPPVIQFQSGDTLAAIKADNAAVINAAIDPASLVPAGTNALIQQLMARITACYALPVEQRVATNGSTAADVLATACRTLFSLDDPSRYLSNGNVVSKTESFNSLFNAGANGIVFDQGSYEFTRGNGDLVVGYHSRSPAGAESRDSLVVRKEGNDLKLIGNGYAYPGSVVAFMQGRVFPTLDQGAYNYRSSGYVLNVTNKTVAGTPLFDHVDVTAPNGATFQLKPLAAYDYLPLVKGATTTNTNFVRLRSTFDASTTAGSPAALEANALVFASPEFSDDEIAAIPAQAVWTFKYYLASAPGTLAATQQYRTRARALTLPEFRTQALAVLTDAQIASMRAAATTAGSVNVSSVAAVNVAWAVPTGALAPTQLRLFGVKYTASDVYQSFTDTAAVASTARSGAIACVAASANDVHCGATAGSYGSSAYGTGLHLWARDSGGREFVNHYATYKLTPPN